MMASATPDDLRRRLRAQRRVLTPAQQDRAARQLRDQLLVVPELRRAERVALYLATDGEISLQPTIEALWRRGVEVSVPGIVDATTMEMRVLEAATPLGEGRHGIAEPTDATRRAVNELDVIVVPSVALDRDGNRLGRGGGYYDRFLAVATGRPPPLLIGVCHALQLVDRLAPGPHDVAVDLVVTDPGSHRGPERDRMTECM